MTNPWPHGGAWLVATTSAAVDWRAPAAVLAAASSVRAAALVLGGEDRPGGEPLGRFATVLTARGGADPLSLDEAAALVRVLALRHGLVLVAGAPGLLVPVNEAGWTAMDLAAALNAPVVLSTDTGPDATNHTTLALGALDGRGLTAAVVIVDAAFPDGASDPPAGPPASHDDPASHDESAPPIASGASDVLPGLPVAPAGRIPVDAADRPDLAAAARRWLNPILHAGTDARETAPSAPETPPPRAASSGKRVVLLIAIMFVAMSSVACGLGFCGRVETYTELRTLRPSVAPRTERPPRPVVPTVAPGPTPDARQVCPQHARGVTATTPDRATTRRVNTAWKRIEDWLAVHAPRSRRALRPPASAAAIAEVQKRMSVPFPPDLVASLRRHDGAEPRGSILPFLYTPLPVDQIDDDWRITCGVLAGIPREDDNWADAWWHPDFVPFATAGDGGALVVDQRPGGHGRVGEFYPENGVDFARWPASVAELLELTAQSLETGRPYDGRYRPRVDADEILTWDVI